jgi:hypothetical protein
MLLRADFSLAGSDYKYPGNNKVLFYAPGFTNYGQSKIAIHGNEYFEHANLSGHFSSDPATILQDTAASVEAVKSFGAYGTVIIQTHGWFWKDELPSSESIPVFRSGTIVPYPYWYDAVTDSQPDNPYWYLDSPEAMDL